jgi:DNA-binding MarR family transcriptional regulator
MGRPVIFRVNPEFEDEWAGSSALATEVVLNTIRVGDALTRRVDAMVRSYGLPSSTALIVLEVLRGAGQPLQPSVIAERSFLSRPALSSVLDTLERRDLLRRAFHPEDRRRVLVEITHAGIDVMARVLPVLHRAEAEWIGGLSVRAKTDLLRQLGHLQRDLLDASG